jgi:Holliday junction resolvasome RuvABC endonuclease subunit
MNTNTTPTILGLDPGTRYLGMAVLRGDNLLDYAVHELRNGERPYDLIGQARRVVLNVIERHAPQVVAIEAPYLIASKRAAVLSALAQELHARSRELGAHVLELSPENVRGALTGNPHATKYEVAQHLGLGRFAQLKRLVPNKPKTPVLWLTARERYWLHMFDALALACVGGQKVGWWLEARPADSETREAHNGKEEASGEAEAKGEAQVGADREQEISERQAQAPQPE